MCTEKQLSDIIREEYDGLANAVSASGLTEDLYVRSMARCFAISLKYSPNSALTIKKPKDWIDRVYKRAVALSD